MKRKVALFLSFIMVLAIYLVACSAPEKPNEPTLGTNDFSDRELVVGIPECNNNFNSYDSYGNDNFGHAQVYDCLVCMNESGEIAPSLAEKYEMSGDGMTYTFWLKKGVKFTNGEELKASDVVFTAQLAMKSPYTSASWAFVDNCEAVDDYTVKIHMKAPYIAFLEILSGSFAHIVNEKAVTEFGDQFGKTVETTVGTGPYILKEWKYGELCVYEANPDYFKGEPDIKKVRFKAITDPNAAVIALETGEMDLYMANLPAVSIDSIAANEKLHIKTYPGSGLTYIIINCEEGIFANTKMRQAVAYAVDRKKMLIMGTEGRGTIVDSPGGPHYNANPGDGTWYQQDVEKAKALVKEAGMEGQTITIKTYATGAYPKLATSLQQDLKNIGLNVEVLQMERNAFIEDAMVNGEYELGICAFNSDSQDMDCMYTHLHSSNIGISGNWSRYVNPEIDTLLTDARGEVDPEKRVELYKQAITIYREDVAEIPLYYDNATRGFTKDIKIADGYTFLAADMIYNYSWND